MFRVCILVRVLWAGGPQRIAFAEAKYLRSASIDTDLVFLRKTTRTPNDYASSSFVIHSDLSKRKVWFHKIFRLITKHYNEGRGEDATVDLDLVFDYERKSPHYDVVIYFDQFTSIFSIIRKVKSKFIKVVYIHETAFRENSIIKKVIERFSLMGSDMIFTNSESNRLFLLGAGYKNVEVLFPGLYLKESVVDFEMRENIAVAVTVWEPWRSPETYLEIAKYLSGVKIILVGQWAEENYMLQIQNLIAKNQLQDKISITGQVSEAELDRLYSKAKVAIRFGYDEQGPGMGSLESISFGIPVIVNESIGMANFLRTFGYDLIVGKEDPEQIADMICNLTSNEGLWKKYSQKIRDIAKNATWEIHGKKLVDTLGNLVDQKL